MVWNNLQVLLGGKVQDVWYDIICVKNTGRENNMYLRICSPMPRISPERYIRN